MVDLFLTNMQLFTSVLTGGMESCGLLVDYFDVFISSILNSYSDGTHSLQKIHGWASDAKFQIKWDDVMPITVILYKNCFISDMMIFFYNDYMYLKEKYSICQKYCFSKILFFRDFSVFRSEHEAKTHIIVLHLHYACCSLNYNQVFCN